MSRINVTCRLDADEVAFIDSIASATERDRSYYIKKAISEFVTLQRYQIEEIQKAIREADAGQFVTDEKMNATWTALGA
jgi:RHH-type transcriptional regulator, rel operon repressor / antitoxin RelB